MNLGEEVLNKISDLLVEIDKPKSPRRKQTMKAKNIYQLSPNRLHNNYKKMRDKIHDRERQKINKQLISMQPFRVQNKHSIFLNNLKKQKPIYQRTQDIIQQRQISISRKKMEVEVERQRKKKLLGELTDQQASFEMSRSKSAKKVTKDELDDILNRLTQRQRQTSRKYHCTTMNYLKSKLLNAKEKPQISQNSNKIWEKKKMQKSLSSNVFERFDQYKWEQQKNQEEFIETIKQNQTPFKPKINKNTYEIAKNMSSRLSLHQQINKTPSCKCFSKHHRHDKTLSPRAQLSQRNYMRSSSAINIKKI